jgi:hypothetical protein
MKRSFTNGRLVLVLCGVLSLCGLGGQPASAATDAPHWTVTVVSTPTSFVRGQEEAYRIQVTNTGGSVSASSETVTIADELPEGLSLANGGISGSDQRVDVTKKGAPGANFTCVLNSCAYTASVIPQDTLVVTVPVTVSPTAPASLVNLVRVEGGGAPAASASTTTAVYDSEQEAVEGTGFGIAPDSATTALSTYQAGAHPDITTSVSLNTINAKGSLAGEPKDVTVEEPPGFAGDLVDTPTCSPAQFSLETCPIATQVGVATLNVLGLTDTTSTLESVPVYNLSPNPGEAAKFGFPVLHNFAVQGNVSVRPGDYGLRVAFHNTDESGAQLEGVSLTVWGVPAAAIHDPWRWKPAGSLPSEFGVASEVAPVPFFTNPTSCGERMQAKMTMNSWQAPGALVEALMPFSPIVGCDRLAFPAAFTAQLTSESTDSPTGLNVDLEVKQTYENPEGLATSTLNKAVVTLPEGMTVNPSAGAGLGVCTPAQYAEEALQAVAGRGCPANSKLGTVSVRTPSLKEEGEGSVFLAEPAPRGEPGRNPFDSLLAIYVVARFQNRGILAKIAGRVLADERTGRLTTIFERQPGLAPLPDGQPQPGLAGLPPVPFSSFTFRFHQGATSPLATPPTCGSYAASVALSPWSEPALALVPELHPFSISSGFAGGPCPAGAPPFSPQVIAGTENNVAGSYSPMSLRIVRNDGEQEITRFSAVLPPGLTANLTGVPFCADASIELARGKTGAQEEAEPSCSKASEIGHTLVGAGVGSVLAQAGGKVYLAGPYNGAPFSIAAITSAKVGPFDLGTVVVREALRIDPNTADVTVDATASDPIPHIIKGIVVHVRDIRVYIDKPAFTLNPTSCARMTFAATVDGAGADPSNPADQMPVTIHDPFQAANCQNLGFKPLFKVSTTSKTSRSKGASLKATLSYPPALQGSQANIRSVKVDLPKQLPSRLTTLQKACGASVFDANPSNCPPESRVGSATAITPILPVPLIGPAYFVSNGGAKFPELVIVLQGYGITIDLRGETFIHEKTGITSSIFRAVPDQPVTTFTLTLPQGPNSALAANGNLCKSKLKMPTVFTAQNGMAIHKVTPIAVTGCPKVKAKSVRHRHRRARGGGSKKN